jgi:hypothetical protein
MNLNKEYELLKLQRERFAECMKTEYMEFVMDVCDRYMDNFLAFIDTQISRIEEDRALICIEPTKIDFRFCRYRFSSHHVVTCFIDIKVLGAHSTGHANIEQYFIAPLDAEAHTYRMFGNCDLDLEKDLVDRFEKFLDMSLFLDEMTTLVAQLYPELKVIIHN